MGDSEETSPDSLKNTPSNIAKLEDLIEHSKGRQKYLAQTISPSDGDDVRWYFCKVPLLPNELAASEPKTEIVGKSEYFRFGMRDSLAIEASFLLSEEELLSSWWREYAECSEGPSERVSSSKKLDKQPTASTSDAIGSTELYEVEEEEERVGVPVKGGLYEVDLVKRHCFPVYWNGENRRVLRGHWFARKSGLDWLPLREDVAEQLEVAYRTQVWHRRRFQPSGLFAARVDLQGSTPGLHALFTGEDDTWEAWLNVDASGFTSVISLGGHGIKLRRGYSASHSTKPSQDELRQQKEEAMDDYCSQVPVRHLVFMVHGIGQRLEKSNLVDDVGNFRHITASLAEQHLSLHQLDTQRVLFIPCQWRKGLKLSGETAVEKCTLDGVRGLRVMLSATVHDVLYYMSPIYCQDIINSVSNQLNRLYLKFLKRNPGYDGKVSLYGHSLGSVISYDILCHQENLSSPFPMDWMYKEHDKVEESFQNLNGEPVTRDSLINLENESSVMNDVKNKGDFADEETMSVKSTELKHEGYDNSNYFIDHSGLSNLDEITATTPDSEQRGDKVDADKLIQNSCNTLPEKSDLNECTLVNYNAPDDGVDKMDSGKCSDTSDKDAAITHLREEIATLKTKIVELELQSDGKENKGVASNKLTQPSNKELPATVDDAPISHTPYIKYMKLEFKVDTFFAVGSPLGVFLALRNIRIGIGNGQDYWEGEDISEEMPACRQMFNIFHPFDPVAYRVEPLVCKEYLNKRPVIVPYHRGGKRLHIGFQEFTEDLAARSQAIKDHFNSVRIKILTACQSKRADDLDEGEEDTEEQFGGPYGSIMMERLTGSEGRIDHMLQDKTFEHPYLQAIGAHTNYWRDYDTALFILRHLYRDIPEEPNSLSGNESKDERRSTVWSDHRETAEEELPLTFSDKIRARNFSSRVNKIMKNS